MTDDAVIRCPECGAGYKLRPEHVGRTVRCKKCRTEFVVEAAEDATEDDPPRPRGPLAAIVRQALTDYAAAVPGHNLEDLGADVTGLRLHAGRIYKVRVVVLTEERVVERVWQTADGKTLTKAELPASNLGARLVVPSTDLAAVGPAGCTTCQGHGHVTCGRCQGTRGLPCKKCGGTGATGCLRCDGSGRARRQHRHSGQWIVATCEACRGKKVVPCNLCLGGKTEVCGSCSGTGRYACPTCGGRRPQQGAATMAAAAAAVVVDPWQADRPPTAGFAALTEDWPVDGTTADTACPVCAGEGRRLCAECHGAGSHVCRSCKGSFRRTCSVCLGTRPVGGVCTVCKGVGFSICGTCNGRGVAECAKCGGLRQKVCRPCGGKGQLRSGVVVRRSVVPSATVHFVGDVACPNKAFRGWELDDEFTPVGRLAAEGASVGHGPDVPDLVRDGLAAITRAEWPAAGSGRRVVRHAIEIAVAEAIHAQYSYDDEQYECWLLGEGQCLHAPANPVTGLMDESLAEVRELADGGQRRQAARLLRDCRAMAKADVYCARRLEEAADSLPDDLGDGGSWLPWT